MLLLLIQYEAHGMDTYLQPHKIGGYTYPSILKAFTERFF